MKTICLCFFTCLVVLIVISCRKDLDTPGNWAADTKKPVPENFFKNFIVPGFSEASNSSRTSTPNNANLNTLVGDQNNGDVAIVLGHPLPNPYTVANMQNAYNLLYGSGYTIQENTLYIRIKANNQDALDSIMKSEVEFQDYPMDYEIVQDGDYYQDPTFESEDIGWLYAAVPSNYSAPANTVMEVIERLYVPENNLLLESMAESLAGGYNEPPATYDVSYEGSQRVLTRTDVNGVEPYYPIPCSNEPDNCEPNPGPGPGPTPPPAKVGIFVQDIIHCSIASTEVPLRKKLQEQSKSAY